MTRQRYGTERCVIQLTEKGLVVTKIMPGIDAPTDIIAASMGRVAIAENASKMPTALLGVEPLGMPL